MTKKQIRLDNVHNPFTLYPHAIKSGGLVFTSGIRPQLMRGAMASFADIPKEGQIKRQGYAFADHDEGAVSGDSWSTHENLEAVLKAAGTSGDQILRQHIWQMDKRYFPCYEQIRKCWQPHPSPSSGLGVAAVAGPGSYWIGIDAIAAVPGESKLFGHREVTRAVDNIDLPSASHYSQAVRSGPLVFTAGHIPIDTARAGMPLVTKFEDIPDEGRFLETGRSHPDSRDGPIAVQSWYVYAKLRDTLIEQGLSMADVVHATVYLADLRDFAVFHRVHQSYFEDNPPSICVTGFDEVGHRGCLIEIELTAVDPSSGLETDHVNWTGSPPLAGPAARRVGPLVFFSGMCGTDELGSTLQHARELEPEVQRFLANLSSGEHLDGLAVQCWQSFDRLRRSAEGLGVSLSDLVKLTVYLADIQSFAMFDLVRSAFLDAHELPALEVVIVHGPAPVRGLHVQLEAIAMMPH